MIDLGTVKPGSTLRIPFSSFDKDDGSSITMTNYAAADMLVYKDGGTTERASTSGFTATTDFDGKTGKHLAIIDLSDNTTAGFWNAGSEYLVAIDAVTVDAVTTGGWIARFRIGYPNSVLDTTIATLASQTSFTLTTGPAENSALLGAVVLIHNIASAIQCGWGVVSAYTGATKTVTLTAGVTFTAAAGDNISFFPPVNAAYWNALATVALPLAPTTAGRTLDVSATGEAGVDWANVGSPTTAVDLSGTTIKTTQKVDVDTIKTNPVVNGGTITFPTNATVASTTNITAGTVTTATNVTTVNGLAANVITATSINADAITAAKIADGAIDAATFAASAINAAAIAADAITAAKIADGAIDAATFAAGAINAAAIAADAITDAKVAADVTIASVTGAVGSVTGAVGSVTGAVGSVTAAVTLTAAYDAAKTAAQAGDAMSLTAAVRPGIRKNTALAAFEILMTDSTNHNPATGLTVTVTRSIDGGAFGAGTLGAVTELSNGIYKFDFAAGDLNGDVVTLRATATGADDLFVTIRTNP